MSRRALTFTLAAVLTAVLAVLATVLPVPYVVLVPGPATDTLGNVPGSNRPVVAVQGARTYQGDGRLYLTTVGVVPGSCADHPSLLQAVRAWFDKTKAVQPHQVICPPGESSKAVQQQNQQDMTNSQRDAITAALLQLGYRPATEQVVVGDVTPGLPADSVLVTGDVILAVDGTSVSNPDQLRALVGKHAVGTAVSLTIERAGKRQEVKVRTVDSNHRTIIGITPDIRATFKNPQVRIGIDPASVGGPSAGLMFTLGIIDKLTPGNLTGGRIVAGTGTIDAFGQVGPIGGIQQKIAGATAKDVGATVFLTPAGDCAEAKAAAPKGLILVKVDTLKTALDGLQAITSGAGSYARC
jgi:PDZ domain-containing protein